MILHNTKPMVDYLNFATQGLNESKSKVMRVPSHLNEQFEEYKRQGGYRIPKLKNTIPEGFPFSAHNYIESYVDLNVSILANPKASFIVEASGTLMTGFGIKEGDWLIVDAEINAKDNDIVMVNIKGCFSIKQLVKKNKKLKLLSTDETSSEVSVLEQNEPHITGVVVSIVRHLTNNRPEAYEK